MSFKNYKNLDDTAVAFRISSSHFSSLHVLLVGISGGRKLQKFRLVVASNVMTSVRGFREDTFNLLDPELFF